MNDKVEAQNQALSQLHRIADEKGFITVDDIMNSSEAHSLSIREVDRISQTIAFSDLPVHSTTSVPIESRRDPMVVYEEADSSVKQGSYSYIIGSKENGYYAIVDGARGYSKKIGKLLRAIINALLSQHEKEILALRDNRTLQGSSFLSTRYQDWPLGGIKVSDDLYVRVVYQSTEANEILRKIYNYCQTDIIADSHIILPPESKEAEEEDDPILPSPKNYSKPSQPRRTYSHYTNPPSPWKKGSVVSTNNNGQKQVKDVLSQHDFSILLKSRGNTTLAEYMGVNADDYQGYSLADLSLPVRAVNAIKKLLPRKYLILLPDILRLAIGKIGYVNGMGVTTWNSLISEIKRIKPMTPKRQEEEIPSRSPEEKEESFTEKRAVVTGEENGILYTTSDPEIAKIGAALEKLNEKKKKAVMGILINLIDLTE